MMLQGMLSSLASVAVALLLVQSVPAQVPAQVPLRLASKSGQRSPGGSHQHTLGDENPTVEWSLDNLPNPNGTDHLIFETMYSLLQHWPNTRMRNGHNIVPGVVQKGTLLYHGTRETMLPKGPEWTATDPEHAYLFCRPWPDIDIPTFDRPRHVGGWLFTLMTTRPLKVLYFDGSSSLEVPWGTSDTQYLIPWIERSNTSHQLSEELGHVEDLCNWGKNFGIDGFVRMEMDFEVILCDFTAGVEVISSDHVASDWSGELGFSSAELFEVMNSGAWHNRFPGETRVQLDLSGLVSFYDTQIAPSLVPIRAGQERWDHRVMNASSEDLLAAKSRLEENLMRPDGASSGINWQTLIQVIVDRYAQRLELTRYLMDSLAANADEALDFAKKTHTQLRIMLTPYILFSTAPANPLDKTDLQWTTPIYKRCAMMHTNSMELRFDSMTDSEKTLLRAVRETSREICRVVTKMWAAGVYAGIDASLNTKASPDITEITLLRGTWREELNTLMNWLDWGVWVKCNPTCGTEEICYLPTWPVGFPWLVEGIPPMRWPYDEEDDDSNHKSRRGMSSFAVRRIVMEHLADEARNAIKPVPEEWVRPQPKCVRRITPYTY